MAHETMGDRLSETYSCDVTFAVVSRAKGGHPVSETDTETTE